MRLFFGILIYVIGVTAVITLADEAGLSITKFYWWMTVAPLSLFTGIAAATIARGR